MYLFVCGINKYIKGFIKKLSEDRQFPIIKEAAWQPNITPAQMNANSL